MVIKIQRWSPDTCNCVIEQQVDYDDEGKREPIVSFLMMNDVCGDHVHMASRKHREDHHILSANVLKLVEQTKQSNINQVEEKIRNEPSAWKRKHLEKCKQQVIEFNKNLDEEWGELIQPAHAFDSHIHEQVLSESRAANARKLKQQEQEKQDGGH